MTVSLKHKFRSPLPDGVNPNLIRPSNWNDEHDLTIPENTILGRVESGEGPASALTQEEVIAFLGDDVGGIDSVEEDPAPKLGGDLDLNGHDITGTGNVDITGDITASGYGAFLGGGMGTQFSVPGVYLGIETNGNAQFNIVSTGTYGYFDIGGINEDYKFRFLTTISSGDTDLQTSGTVSVNGSEIITASDVGTAAAEDSTAFATAAQGTLADSAVQPGDLGTAASQDSTAFATAAQGALADSATQPGDLAAVATSGAYGDLSGTPTLGTAAALDIDTDTSLTADSDTKIPSQKAVKAYVDANAGGGGTGDVVGPSSSTDGDFAQFDGTTGKLLKGGKAAPSGTVVGSTDTQTLTNKTIDLEDNTLTGLRFWSDIDSQPDWMGDRSWSSLITFGKYAGENLPDNDADVVATIAIGDGALRAAEESNSNIAIGHASICNYEPGYWNIALGKAALANLQHTGDPTSSADRNIGIGSLAGYGLTSGSQNVLIGRDSGHALEDADNNTFVGYRAGSLDHVAFNFDGITEVQEGVDLQNNTGVGNRTLCRSTGSSNTAVGYLSGANVIGGLNVLIGGQAGTSLDKDITAAGKVFSTPNSTGTYSQSGTTITVSITAHGAVAGNHVGIQFTSGTISDSSHTLASEQWMVVTSVTDANTFVLTAPVSLTSSGNCTLSKVEGSTTRSSSDTNVIIGERAGDLSTRMNGVVIIGWEAGRNLSGDNRSVAVGRSALDKATTGNFNVALGNIALRSTIAGGDFNYSHCVGLGDTTACSGDNQVQLGNSSSTTYAYGTVQNRSDIRDKADVRDTVLGLEFINALHPVDYKWDMRDDYIVHNDDGSITKLPKDGSKKRNRFHHGLIAQEVKEVLASLNVDFGGYQDHSVKGGDDVMSIGYAELIGPLIKAVQELSAEVAALKAAQ